MRWVSISGGCFCKVWCRTRLFQKRHCRFGSIYRQPMAGLFGQRLEARLCRRQWSCFFLLVSASIAVVVVGRLLWEQIFKCRKRSEFFLVLDCRQFAVAQVDSEIAGRRKLQIIELGNDRISSSSCCRRWCQRCFGRGGVRGCCSTTRFWCSMLLLLFSWLNNRPSFAPYAELRNKLRQATHSFTQRDTKENVVAVGGLFSSLCAQLPPYMATCQFFVQGHSFRSLQYPVQVSSVRCQQLARLQYYTLLSIFATEVDNGQE